VQKGEISKPSEIRWMTTFVTFTDDWKVIANKYKKNPLTESLPLFFLKWNKLPDRPLPIKSREVGIISYDALSQFLMNFIPAMKKLQESGTQVNVWEVAGLKHNEVRISSVLNWLLTPYATHGQGGKICEVLLERINTIAQSDPRITSIFPSKDDLYDQDGQVSYNASVEVCPSGKLDNRVDIVLDGKKILLYIEVKIDASQGKEQLKRYHNLAKERGSSRKWGVVYLTPKGEVPRNATELCNCIAISWADVANALRKYERTLDYGNLSRHYIGQFAQYVSKF